MNNFGLHIKTTCIKSDPDRMFYGFSCHIISQRYLIIIGRSNMEPKDGIVFCDTKSKAQYNIDESMIKLLPQRLRRKHSNKHTNVMYRK